MLTDKVETDFFLFLKRRWRTILNFTNLSVNFLYRVIKLTSPTINYFIIAGTILMYASVYFYLIPAFTPSVAQAGCLVRIIVYCITG